jgi:hypothetical protein
MRSSAASMAARWAISCSPRANFDVALSVDLRAGVLGVTKMLRSHIRTAHGAATLRCQLCQHLGTQCGATVVGKGWLVRYSWVLRGL